MSTHCWRLYLCLCPHPPWVDFDLVCWLVTVLMVSDLACCFARTTEQLRERSTALRLQSREGVTSWETPVPNTEPPGQDDTCAHYRLGAPLWHAGFPRNLAGHKDFANRVKISGSSQQGGHLGKW